MTHRFSGKIRSGIVLALLVTTLTALLALMSPAQVKSAAISADSLFLPVQSYAGGGDWVGVADLNGDGKPDLVIVPGQVQVLLGNGDGTFAPGYSSPAGTGGFMYTGAIADVNGDGKLDVLVTRCGLSPECSGDGVVGVLIGNGDGTFQPEVDYDAGGSLTYSVAVADVNGDGKPDLVVTNSLQCAPCANGIGVLLGNGDGTFQPVVTYSVKYQPWSVVIADVNGDGKPDVVVASSVSFEVGTNWVEVLLGNGNGTFQPAAYYNPGGANLNNPVGLAIADLNGDGKPDIAVVNGGPIAVLLGNGDGTFQPPVNYHGSQTFSAQSVAVADVNSDGVPDLLVTDGGNLGVVDIFLGNGDGTFQSPPAVYAAGGTGVLGIAAGDLNGDGKVDVVIANANSPNATGVLLNKSRGTDSTTITLALTPSTSNYGQPVQFTATVTAASGKPTGTVVFVNNEFNGSYGPANAVIGYAKLTNGHASFSTSSLTPNTYSMSAMFEGFGKFIPSASASLTEVVNKVTSTTSLSSSANPVRPSETVTYTATVTNQAGLPSHSGYIIFLDNGSTLATVGQTPSNQASYKLAYRAIGVHSIVAMFSGDQDNLPSTSAPLTEIVSGASQTVVTTSQSPSLFGQRVTFKATVSSKYGAIPDGELVTFYDDLTPLGTGKTASGVATFTTSSLAAKSHLIRATYAGDTTLRPSTGTVKQVVNKYGTTTTLASNLNPSNFGQAVTLTAKVISSGPSPAGIVVFREGAKGLGATKVVDGIATLGKSNFAVGSHSVTAYYEGDAASSTSNSAVLIQVVK